MDLFGCGSLHVRGGGGGGEVSASGLLMYLKSSVSMHPNSHGSGCCPGLRVMIAEALLPPATGVSIVRSSRVT